MNLYDLLGSEIVYLYEYNKQGERKLIWAKKLNDKDEMLTLMYVENKVSFDAKTYELDYYDGKAYRTIKLNKDIDVVYNDEYVMGGIEELLTNEFYSVKLIERKGVYKCLILKSYENYIVGGIDVAEQYIYDKLTGNILDISAFDKVQIKNTEGKTIEFDSIKTDDVLTVYESKSGEKAEIIVSDSKAEGIVKLVKKDKSGYQYITIDDKAYRFASLDKEEKISVSSEIVLYLDAYGHIAMVKDCENIENLAYLLQSYYDKKEEKLYVRLFDKSGKILVLECAKKLKINEDKTYKDLENADLRLKNCGSGLMLYKKNVDGQIKNIQLATNDQTSKLRLRFPKESLRYRSTGSRLGQKMCLDNNTVIFGVPSDVSSATDEDFIVTNKAGLYGDENYTTESYAYTEKVGYEQILVIYDNDWNYDQGNKAGVLVTEISKVVNEEGTLVDCIGGWQGAQQVEKICHEDYSAESSGVEIGDYIIFSQNKQGEIVGISVKYDLSTGKRPKGKDMHIIEALSSGYVHEVNGNVVTVGLESGADFDMAYDFASGAVLIYYEDSNHVETGTVNDLIPYETAGEKCDFLLTHMRYSKQIVYVVYR